MYYVYILAKKRNGTFYVGMTSNLPERMSQHKTGEVGFTAKYQIHHLVYYEEHAEPYQALTREKLIKRWPRNWKMELIEKFNPHWDDLTTTVFLD